MGVFSSFSGNFHKLLEPLEQNQKSQTPNSPFSCSFQNLPLFPNSVFYKNHTTTYDFLQHSGTSTFAVVHNLTRQISETQHGFEDDGLRFSTLLCPPTQARRRRRLRQVRQRTHSHLRPRRQGHGGYAGGRQGVPEFLHLHRRDKPDVVIGSYKEEVLEDKGSF